MTDTMRHLDNIAIKGIGCLCALGKNLGACMDNLLTGKQTCGPPANFTVDRPDTYPVFEVDNSHIRYTNGSTELGRTARLALTAAEEAIRDSGLSPDDLGSLRVGVVVGTTVGCTLNNEEFYRRFKEENHPDLDEINRFFKSNPAEAIAREFNLNGPVESVVNACSSGADAIGIGISWLHAGLCDLVIAGGADELSRISYLGFISLMISDSGKCRPFDTARQGLNLGEGAAMLLLSRSQTQKSRCCELAGYASACDAYHLTAPHPDGTGLRKALKTILQKTGNQTENIAFVNAHGTGTPDNDRVEMQILSELLPHVPYFSIKGGTGHTLGAAGAIEAALTISCLLQKKIPLSTGCSIPEDDVNPPVMEKKEIKGNYAISQSLAFGGNNSVLLFRAPE
jgi:3-oxoacyl-[acyl-carrier-protein] synthase-1/3-oxoacyl-[acyl-carrier-protein] synthase II